jgi:hypothetical protein
VRSPPGRCGIAALLFVATVIVLALLGLAGPARAQKRPKPEAAPPAVAKTGAQKTKTYTFGGLDIDGKLKTPQLLYFLNRMKSELDATTPERRSFLPELQRSTDEM